VLWQPQGRHHPHRARGVSSPRAVRRGYEMCSPACGAASSCWKVRPHGALQRESVRRDGTGRPRYLVRPMNCPFHIAIYRSQLSLASRTAHPLRRSLVPCTVTAHPGGCTACCACVVHPGDALFLREDQIEEEMAACLRFGLDASQGLRFADVKPSCNPARKLHGEKSAGIQAEAAIRRVLGKPRGCPSSGRRWRRLLWPLIDLKIRDALAAMCQCTTFQLDFQLPERFQLEYVESDGSRQRPVMIHRALLVRWNASWRCSLSTSRAPSRSGFAARCRRACSRSARGRCLGPRGGRRACWRPICRADADLSADKLGAKIRARKSGEDSVHAGGGRRGTWLPAWFRRGRGTASRCPPRHR